MTPTINSEIPLQGKPVQQPNILEQYARIQQIKAETQNMAARQQQIANAAQENQFNALKMQEYQKQTAGVRAEASAQQAHTTYDGQGNPSTDTKAVYQDLMKGGYVAQANDYRARDFANQKAGREAARDALNDQALKLGNAQKLTEMVGEHSGAILGAIDSEPKPKPGAAPATAPPPSASPIDNANIAPPLPPAGEYDPAKADSYKPGDIVQNQGGPNKLVTRTAQGGWSAQQMPNPTAPDNAPTAASAAAPAIDPAVAAHRASVNAKYQQSLQQAKALGADISQEPPTLLASDGTYDPQALANLKNHQQNSAGGRAQIKEAQDINVYNRGVIEAKEKMAGEGAKTKSEQVDAAAKLFSAASNPDMWSHAIATLKDGDNPIPQSVLDMFGPTWSAKAQADAARTGVTPAQATTEANATARTKEMQRRTDLMDQRLTDSENKAASATASLAREREDRIASDSIDKKRATAETNVKNQVSKTASAAIKNSSYNTPEEALADASKTLGTRDKNGVLPAGDAQQARLCRGPGGEKALQQCRPAIAGDPQSIRRFHPRAWWNCGRL